MFNWQFPAIAGVRGKLASDSVADLSKVIKPPTEQRSKKEQTLASRGRRLKEVAGSGTSAQETGGQNKTPIPAGKASVTWNQLSKPRGHVCTIVDPPPPWAGSTLSGQRARQRRGLQGLCLFHSQLHLSTMALRMYPFQSGTSSYRFFSARF